MLSLIMESNAMQSEQQTETMLVDSVLLLTLLLNIDGIKLI